LYLQIKPFCLDRLNVLAVTDGEPFYCLYPLLEVAILQIGRNTGCLDLVLEETITSVYVEKDTTLCLFYCIFIRLPPCFYALACMKRVTSSRTSLIKKSSFLFLAVGDDYVLETKPLFYVEIVGSGCPVSRAKGLC